MLPPDWTIWHLLPLHLCDALIFIAVFALITERQTASELLYFWACSGTLLAITTPDLGVTWPTPEFLSYFALHGGVVAAAVIMTGSPRGDEGTAWPLPDMAVEDAP